MSPGTASARRMAMTAMLATCALAGPAAMPVHSQSLSDGDYARCEVRRDGDFIGYDSVCLERKRAALRRLRNDEPRAGHRRTRYDTRNPGVHRCPHSANGGRGYNATWYSDGQPPSLTGAYTYDATLDGRPCIPHPTYYGTGYP